MLFSGHFLATACPTEGKHGMADSFREHPPISREPLAIVAAAPKQPDSAEIQDDMVRLGLSCELASQQNIRQYISDVKDQIPNNPHGHESYLIGKRDSGLRSALSRPALEFVLHAPRVSQHTLSRVPDVLSAHPGCDDFLRHILADNPGGARFVSAVTGVGHEEPDFYTRLPAEFPNTVRLLTILAQNDVVPTSNGTWVPDESARYMGTLVDNLADVMNHDRFDCLREKPEKTDKKHAHLGDQYGAVWGTYKYQQLDRFNWNEPTANIIKNSYVGLASNATAFLDVGLETQNLVSILSNKIAGVQDSQLSDYHPGVQELLIFLVKDPEMDGNEPSIDGAGALSITWDIFVKQYKEKKRTYKSGWMDVWLRSALFQSYAEFNDVSLEDQIDSDADQCS